MNGSPEPVGTVEVALAHTQRLLQTNPADAVEQASEILKVAPNHPGAMFLRGLALGRTGQGDAAVEQLRRTVRLKPDMGEAWRALGDHLAAVGDAEGADQAYAQHIRYSTRDPRLMEAGRHLCEGRIAPAEALLREHLKQFPTDVPAIRMLAEVAGRLGRYGDAENLLRRCLELAPSFTAARRNLALVLHRQNKLEEALAEVDRLLAADPRDPGSRNLKAGILGRVGEYAESIRLYSEVLEEYPHNAKAWMSYGHALKTAGRATECVDAYRKSIDLQKGLGEAYWSLANLKTFRFTDAELETMRAQLARTDLTEEDRYHFHFAIGKALEDTGRYAESFEHYDQGNRLRLAGVAYAAEDVTSLVERSRALFTRAFFEERPGVGCAAPDPIFIVGLPRAGSTLLEQILSSHSRVEGTMELPDMIALARTLSGRKNRAQASKYPEILGTLDASELRALGERYLEQTRIQRKTGAPFFIDKMPNNFLHVGMIHLALPKARIIDARRHPMACCFSGFKQHFARGQHFTYSLDGIGRYYRNYVELMAHFDDVLPGRIHRVLYERMIDDTEAEVRRLLDYCGLPFEAQCLRFYQNDRAVRTASAEQVRQPIYKEGVDHWRHYEPWLGPLKDVLGPVLEAYPGAP